jgi:Ketopantoate hydroxymethyltransferase
MLGLFDRFLPPFVKQYAQLGDVIVSAARNYAEEVRQCMYPKPLVECGARASALTGFERHLAPVVHSGDQSRAAQLLERHLIDI